jgi:hypothetical protein
VKIETAVNAVVSWHFTLKDAMTLVKLDPEHSGDVIAALREHGIESAE